MLKRDVREMVSYLVGEKKSFKVTFANGKVEVVEYRGYCWVLGNKGYTDEDLVKKMIKFQDNVSKFIIRLEVIEEVEEVEEESSIEVSLVEEVENLTDDLFQDEDLAYCEEAIERESNNVSSETNKRRLINMTMLISMNSGDNFKFKITEENFKLFKTDTVIYNWLKLNDYGYKANTEVYIRKENISYYGIV